MAEEDTKKKTGWSYADIVAGCKVLPTLVLPPPPPPPPPSQPLMPPTSPAPSQAEVICIARSKTRVYEKHQCHICDATGYDKPQMSPTGVEYQKVCKNCNGKGWWIDWVLLPIKENNTL